jgi:hypothetical protein
VQLRFAIDLTSEEYVNRQGWCLARLWRCPLHPQGGCSFARHGTYERVSPPGTLIARWYCPEGHCTFSLLPDCFAARLSGTLVEVEAVVDQVEQSHTLEKAVAELRLDIDLPGVLRWTRRRLQAVHAALTTLKGLMPEHFLDCSPTLASFRQQLAVTWVLITLRDRAAAHLPHLPPPLGFCPRPRPGRVPLKAHQHQTGADPPSILA